MTGRTHDLAAFTALSLAAATQPIHDLTLATAVTAFIANMIGGLAPDLDEPTSELWHELRGGSILAKLISPLFGGHRFISHSLLGVFLAGWIVRFLLGAMQNVLLVNMTIVWWAFMIGFVSHLVTDSLTKEGVPWFFPIPLRLGFPPLKFMRMKTGGIVEKAFIFPLLLLANAYIFYTHYDTFLLLFKHYLK